MRRTIGKVAIIALFGFAVAVVAGCGGGGGGGGGGSTSGLSISGAKAVVPSGFTFEGGNVTIQATVTPANLVQSVSATVQLPDKSTAAVTMSSAGGDVYTGTYVAPVNLNMDGTAKKYTVRVTATPTTGSPLTSNSFTFSVPAPDVPPPPGM
ncbi:MAG TPA: hypothetical protein VGK34_06380 [Armatimonadota bacterium]